MNTTLLDFFRLGLAIGQETKNHFDLRDQLLSIERPSEAAQFLAIGCAVGQTVEDPWTLLEKLEATDGDETGSV